MIVKKGGSDSIRKLYFGKEADMISSYDPDKIILHFGSQSITGATPGELQKHHSLNGPLINTFLHNEGFDLESSLSFTAIEDKYGVLHLVYVNAAEKIKEGRNDLPEPLEGDAGSWSSMTTSNHRHDDKQSQA